MKKPKQDKLKIEIMEDFADMSSEDLEIVRKLTGEADLNSELVQQRMMATAVFVLLTDPDIPLASRNDIFGAWCSYVHEYAQLRGMEHFQKATKITPDLPEEVRVTVLMLKLSQMVDQGWQRLHNLVTVLNPTKRGDEK